MKHVTCKLQSDFHDYYDHELGSTTQDYELEMERYKLKPLSFSEQLTQLRKACFPTPFFGTWKEMRERLKRQAGTLYFDKSWQQETLIQIESKKGQYETITIEQAATLNDNAFTVEVIDEINSADQIHLTYVQVGHYSIWVIRESDGKYHPIETNDSLPKESIAILNQPLFAIEFGKMSGNKLMPTRYDIAPNLKSLGIDRVLTAKQVADALIARIDSSASEPSDEDAGEGELSSTA